MNSQEENLSAADIIIYSTCKSTHHFISLLRSSPNSLDTSGFKVQTCISFDMIYSKHNARVETHLNNRYEVFGYLMKYQLEQFVF